MAVEIQVRTELQHTWAEFSERLSDKLDPGIKYGKGDAGLQRVILQFSSLVAHYEDREARARGMGVEWESRLQVGKNELMRDIREVMEHLIRRSTA